MPDFANGVLQPGIYDDVFKYLSVATDEWTGNDQTIGWVVHKVHLSPIDIREAVSNTGNPRAGEAGAINPGWYLIKINSSGLIWAYGYDKDLATCLRDYQEAEEEFNAFEGWTDEILTDFDENGNLIEPGE